MVENKPEFVEADEGEIIFQDYSKVCTLRNCT